MITEEQLMAYLDGALLPDQAGKVSTALSQDPDLRKLMEDELAVRQSVALAYAPVIAERVPDRLMRPFKRSAPKANTRWFGRSFMQGWNVRTALPAAASLALGLFLGGSLFSTSTSPPSNGFASLDPAVVKALDEQLVANQTLQDQVQIGISFTSLDGSVCRTYQNASHAGIACRAGEQWQVRLLAKVETGRPGEMQQANSATALVMGVAQDMILGEPMNGWQEQTARDAGWQTGGSTDEK
jgi:hypothetical protein